MMTRCFSRSAVTVWMVIAPLLGCGDGAVDSEEPGTEERAHVDSGADELRPFDDSLVVTLRGGQVKGDEAGDSVRFLKIPYAKPPLGELRWKAPEPAAAWKGMRHEESFAPACPQDKSNQGPRSSEEDCLYLNVWAPLDADDAPVMVWIHGGGNFAGSAGDKVPDPLAAADSLPLFYDGRYFAERHGIVVVTLNYRLGPFGFFSHPALEEEGSAMGNQGLLDQRQALLWVQDNIAAFGGDADNVTIFGESAGSADVCMHVVSPLSRGLFHRAVSESGGCTASPRGTRSAAQDEAGMLAFAAALGCDDREGALECLRGKSVDEILDHGMQPSPGSGDNGGEGEWSFDVTVDGKGGFLPDSPTRLFEQGRIADVPYLLGSNTDEGSLFVASKNIRDEEAYLAELEASYGDFAERIAEVYSGEAYGGDYNRALSRVIGDQGLVCPTHDVARRVAELGRPVFMYNFNVPWKVSFGVLGAAHASEIGHVFGNPYRPDARDERVSEAMNAYWASFARSGDPAYDGAPAQWPAFEPGKKGGDVRLQLDDDFDILTDFRKEECALWREYYAEQRSRTE